MDKVGFVHTQVELPDRNRYFPTFSDEKILCPDFCASTRLFLRSPDSCEFMFRLSCVHQIYMRSAEFCAFMFRHLFVHQTCVPSQDVVRSFSGFRAFVPTLHAFKLRQTVITELVNLKAA